MVEEIFEILLSETLQNDLVLLFLSKWCLRHGWKQFLAYLTATLTDGQQTTTWTESINVLHWSDMGWDLIFLADLTLRWTTDNNMNRIHLGSALIWYGGGGI